MISWMAFCVNCFFEIFFGHACGVRVQRVQKVQRVQRVVVAADAAGCIEGLHRFAQGATAPAALRVADCRSASMLIKSALRDLLSVSYGMISILRIGSLRSPPPIRLRRTSPYAGGRIKHLEASLRKRLCSKHGLLCHLEEGERWWRQPPKGECISSSEARLACFPRAKPGYMVYAAKGGIKNGAP